MASGVFRDLTNARFEKLLVIKRLPNFKNKVVWECICDCGNKKNIRADSLLNNTKSCGCIQKEKAKITGLSFRKPNQLSLKNDLFSNYKRRANKKNYIFNITFDVFCEMINLSCYYCGSYNQNEYNDKVSKQKLNYNGIDRKDSTKGYIEGNIVTCCGQCNYMKLDYNETEFLNKIELIYNKRIKK